MLQYIIYNMLSSYSFMNYYQLIIIFLILFRIIINIGNEYRLYNADVSTIIKMFINIIIV